MVPDVTQPLASQPGSVAPRTTGEPEREKAAKSAKTNAKESDFFNLEETSRGSRFKR